MGKHRRHIMLLLATTAALSMALPTCNHVPIESLQNSFSLQVAEPLENVEPIKLDFLWVVDNSTSMCEEQVALASNFDAFIDILSAYPNLDIRLAVVNTDSYEHYDYKADRTNIPGQFQNTPATTFPPSCAVAVVKECSKDIPCEDIPLDLDCDGPACAALGGTSCDAPSKWRCEGPTDANKLVSKDGSVNTSCVRSCDDDAECQCLFGEAQVCNLAGQNSSGCREPPQTLDKCFDGDGEPVLTKRVIDNDLLDLFKCIGTVGADQSTQANLEAGLGNAWTSLDKGKDICTAPSPNVCDLYSQHDLMGTYDTNATTLAKVIAALDEDPGDSTLLQYEAYLEGCQDRIEACFTTCKDDSWASCPEQFFDPNEPNFLRSDAYLVVIFISDEDDCSLDEGKQISGNDHDKCAFMGTSDEPHDTSDPYSHPLAPVKKLVNEFKAIKSDPSKVVVATIIGDVLTGGASSCLVPDDCTTAKKVDECSCYLDGSGEGCPTLLAEDADGYCMDASLDTGGCYSASPDPGCEELLAEELSYRIECIDACFGGYVDRCSALVPDECGCYAAGQSQTDECAPLREDEPSYRAKCRIACFQEVQPDTFSMPNVDAYVCQSTSGVADFGSRYKAFAEAFGPHGLVASICSPTGIGPILEDVATLLITIFTKVCLPAPVLPGESLKVIQELESGEEVEMVMGSLEEGGDYVVQNTPECDGTKQAVVFTHVLPPGASIRVSYQADTAMDE